MMRENLEISTVYRYGRYEVYVNGNFWATCENWHEVTEEIEEIEELPYIGKGVKCS